MPLSWQATSGKANFDLRQPPRRRGVKRERSERLSSNWLAGACLSAELVRRPTRSEFARPSRAARRRQHYPASSGGGTAGRLPGTAWREPSETTNEGHSSPAASAPMSLLTDISSTARRSRKHRKHTRAKQRGLVLQAA